MKPLMEAKVVIVVVEEKEEVIMDGDVNSVCISHKIKRLIFMPHSGLHVCVCVCAARCF